jgi:hypothetical protein
MNFRSRANNIFWFLVFCFSFVFLFLGIAKEAKAAQASFYVLPESGEYEVGKRFSVSVFIDSDGAAINASQAVIYFPADKLKVVEISKAGSIFTLWPEEVVFSNSEGKITFAGGLPSPGYTGEKGKIFTIIFQGKAAGEAKVYFRDEAILANDARGTNIFGSSRGGIYKIVVPTGVPTLPPEIIKLPPLPKVYSPTHPQSDKWYSNNNPILKWDLPPDVIGVSTVFNQEFVYNVPAVSEGLFSSKNYSEVEDGVWYFHIRFQNKDGWGEISRFKIQIDTKPPYPFEIKVDNEGDSTNPQPILYFQAKDDTSGINHYEIKIGQGEVFSLLEVQTNPVRMPHQDPGLHSLEIKAVDNAGNSTLSATEVAIESIPSPEISTCPPTLVSGEEILHLEGNAPINHTVIIFLNKDGKTIKTWEVAADSKGSWVLEDNGLFKSGIYKISSRAKNNKGAISNPSPECTLKIILSGISIGPWILRYQCLIWFALLILLILLIILIYIYLLSRKERRYVEREAKDLRKKFYKEYNELKEDIRLQLEMFRKVKAERELTKEEEKLEERLLKDLKDIEVVLDRELKDIERGR